MFRWNERKKSHIWIRSLTKKYVDYIHFCRFFCLSLSFSRICDWIKSNESFGWKCSLDMSFNNIWDNTKKSTTNTHQKKWNTTTTINAAKRDIRPTMKLMCQANGWVSEWARAWKSVLNISVFCRSISIDVIKLTGWLNDWTINVCVCVYFPHGNEYIFHECDSHNMNVHIENI